VSLCAHRTRESRPPKPCPTAIPAQVGGRSSFWRAQLYVTARLYVQLVPGGVRYYITTSYYFQKDIHGTALLLFFLHQLTIDYFKQLNMSTIENGTRGGSGTGPSSRYNLKLSRLFVVFVLFLYRLSVNTNNFYDAIILLILNNNMIFLLNFEIKIYHKMPKLLTPTGVKLNQIFFRNRSCLLGVH
jgi:hypothetical protein